MQRVALKEYHQREREHDEEIEQREASNPPSL
jgi:hypothetical protein